MRRFPPWVFREGSEPDPRFSLANERTFLAWIRTAVALFAAGVALEAIALPVTGWLRGTAAVAFVALGLLAAAQAWLGWAMTERALRRATPLGGPSVSLVITIGVVVAVTLIGIGLVLR